MPRSALVFNLSGLGDTLFFLPALAAWKRAEPDVRVTALTMFPAVRDLLSHTNLVDEVIDRDFLRVSRPAAVAFFLGLRRRRFDWGVLPYGSNRLEYNLANFLSGASRRVAHRYRLDPWRNLDFLNHITPPQRTDRHAVEANLDLLTAAGLIPDSAPSDWPRPALTIPLPTRERAAQRWEALQGARAGRICVGVHAGSNVLKNQDRRCYPAPLLAAAMSRIAARHPEIFFVIFEGESDRARTDALMAALPEGLAARVAPGDILECAALVERCALFLANDSGILHLAAFCGRPALALFGPTNPVYVHPWGVPHRVVARGLACQPCFEYSRRPLSCPAGIDFACITELPPEKVAEEFERLLVELTPAA